MQIRVKPLRSCGYCALKRRLPVPAGEVSEDRPHAFVFVVWEDEDGREWLLYMSRRDETGFRDQLWPHLLWRLHIGGLEAEFRLLYLLRRCLPLLLAMQASLLLPENYYTASTLQVHAIFNYNLSSPQSSHIILHKTSSHQQGYMQFLIIIYHRLNPLILSYTKLPRTNKEWKNFLFQWGRNKFNRVGYGGGEKQYFERSSKL